MKRLAIPFVVILAALAVVIAGCIPNDKWRKIAEMTNSNGMRFVVAQQHYDWVEGWAVTFFLIDSDEKFDGSTLEIESGRWWNVSLIQSNDTVEVWRADQLVGTYNSSNRVFKNYLSNSYTTLTNGSVYAVNRFLD